MTNDNDDKTIENIIGGYGSMTIGNPVTMGAIVARWPLSVQTW